ncbi:MAG: fructose-bisphosphate aldolase class I [Actinomycetota bacterium]|nr:fructose-bisphosphate aldolase class I [Actinomycetota bacterium]
MSEDQRDLESIAKAIVADGRGILAADESNKTMTKRLEGVDVESTEESRRTFRELLFTTEGAEDYISGVIMYDETIRQSTSDGTPFPEFMKQHGVIPGIKVDTGAKPLSGSPDEKVTEGLDGLRERLEEYYDLGARFAKWRAVITIGDGIPTDYCIHTNAHALARYAALCQEQGLVPIVEPEVLMDGEHGIDTSYDVTLRTLHTVFDELFKQRIHFEGMLLKPNMVMSAYDCPEQASVDEVAERTVRCMRNVVPAAVPGLVFLSGGQSDERASQHLNAMNAMEPQPWALSFSYGRALQGLPLNTWRGEESNVAETQAAYLHRAKLTGAAARAEYSEEMEQEYRAAA